MNINLEQRDNLVSLATAVLVITQPVVDRQESATKANLEFLHALAITALKNLERNHDND